MQVGLSDQFISSSANFSNADMRGTHNTTNHFGMYLSPGLFFQTDKGHIGVCTKQRFHTGVTSYEDGGSSEHSQKMFDWGFQGGFITGKISHTILLESSRTRYKFKESNVWPEWSNIEPERRFSYTIGINIPCVLKMEKAGEHATMLPQTKDPLQEKPIQKYENAPVTDAPVSSTPLTETSINLQGDIFKPRCVSECQSSGTDVEQCPKRVEDAWYNAVTAKSHYMASSTENNRDAYVKAIGVLKELCPDACK
jgi:hypothetical protein